MLLPRTIFELIINLFIFQILDLALLRVDPFCATCMVTEETMFWQEKQNRLSREAKEEDAPGRRNVEESEAFSPVFP